MRVHQEAELAGIDAVSLLRGASGPTGTTVRMSDGSVYAVTRVLGPGAACDQAAAPDHSTAEQDGSEAAPDAENGGPARQAAT